ncbi:unnamed protein product [Candida verbasci]|uniref:RING-type E3 ubiquitin transferase n=1 Tax=Candida verbasci TaxID=1227364 RepID=A0A9W4XEC9_9ASCO|nr:unnamed protein product [Candida verbasci]
MNFLSNAKSRINSSSVPKLAPTGKIIQGDLKTVIPYVQNDISITKAQLKQYENNDMYSKLINLIQKNQKQNKQHLDDKYINQKDSPKYQWALFELYKSELDEYSDLLDMFKNNYTHLLCDNNLLNYKLSKSAKSTSITSSTSMLKSRDSSVFSRDSSTSLKSFNVDIDDDAPDHLLDPISFELFVEPVITPSGITYEKKHLVSHLRNKGQFDPISKQSLNQKQLYPNLTIKDSVEAYKDQKIKEINAENYIDIC